MTDAETELPASRKKGGRPSLFTPALIERVLTCLVKGMPFSLAASAAGCSYQSLITYRNAHPEFNNAIQSAIALGVEKRLEKIEKASDSGDWRASAWLLEHCQPEFFAKTRIQVEAVGHVQHEFVIPKEILDGIAESRKKHDQRQLESKLESNGV